MAMVRKVSPKAWLTSGLAVLVLLGGVLATNGWAGQPPAVGRVLMVTPFDKDANGWITFGEKAKTAVQADTVSGKASLCYDYTVEKANFSALILPINEGEIGGARAIRFSVKTDYPTTVLVALQESVAGREEGRYVALFHSAGGKWQEVALAPTDFLQDDTTSKQDSNGKLDLDKVQMIAIGDFLQFIAQSEDSLITDLLGLKRGSHQLFLQDFRITTELLPGAPYLTPSDSRLDTFAHPQIGWLSLGDMKMSLHSGRPIDGRGLKATYPIGPGKVAAMMRQIPVGHLRGKTKIQCSLASVNPGLVILQLEEKSGGKYQTVMEVPGENQSKTFDLPFSDFKPSDDSKDNNDKLDIAEVKSVAFIDASGLIGMAKGGGENTLYLSGLRAQ